MLTSFCSGAAGAPLGEAVGAAGSPPDPSTGPAAHAQLCPAGAPSSLALGLSCPQTAHTWCPWDQVEAHVLARPSSLSGLPLSPPHTHIGCSGAIAGHCQHRHFNDRRLSSQHLEAGRPSQMREGLAAPRPFSLGPNMVWSRAPHPGGPLHVS